jgi:hypothetical protein
MAADDNSSFWDKVPHPHFLTVMKERLTDLLPDQLKEYLHLHLQTQAQLQFSRLSAINPPPANLPASCACASSADADIIADFLRAFYKTGGTQSAAPISSLTAEQIHAASRNGNRFILLKAPTGPLLGTISSQPIGHLRRGQVVSSFPVRYISNFCVHPQQRRQGAASRLLQAMWADGRSIQEDAMLFLKEGAPLLKAGPAIYSSRWIYRRVADGEVAAEVTRVSEIPVSTGVHAVVSTIVHADVSTSVHADASIIVNVPNTPIKSRLYKYKGARGSIIAAFSNAHQVHSADGAPIYYMTGWVVDGELLLTERLTAARQLAAAVASAAVAPNTWVWIDEALIGAAYAPWKRDGTFHYYAFNWTAPHLYGKSRPFLML